jgi:DNA-binding response OmpR family regulator
MFVGTVVIPDDAHIDSNVLKVHIHNSRKKFGSNSITTIRGVGYVLKKSKGAQAH